MTGPRHAKPEVIRSACEAMASWMFGTFLANMKPAYEAHAFNLDVCESACPAFWSSQHQGLGRHKVGRMSPELQFPVWQSRVDTVFEGGAAMSIERCCFAAATLVVRRLPGPKLKQVWVDIEHKCWETLLLSNCILKCCSFGRLLLRTTA